MQYLILRPEHITRIIFLGIILRIIWAIFIPVNPISDSAAYDTFANMLWQHGVYGWTPDSPSAYWAVGTSAITAATYFVLGETYLGVVVLNLLTSMMLMVLVWKLGTQYFGKDAAIWAAAIVAFWPNLIFFTSILSSELYFMAFTLGGLYFWSRERGSPWWNLLLCGLIWGLACYIRPVILLFPVALLIASFSQGLRATGLAAIKTVGAIVLIVMIVSPWTMRNADVIGKAYLVSSNFGTNLWMGNNPDSDGSYTRLPSDVLGMSEVDREEYLAAKAKAYISEDPARFLRTVGHRILDLHGRETIGIVWNETAVTALAGKSGVTLAKLIASAYWIALVLSGLSALLILWPQHRLGTLFHPIFGGWAYFTAVHAVIVSGDRYHMPSAPFVALLAGVTIAWLIRTYFTQKANI